MISNFDKLNHKYFMQEVLIDAIEAGELGDKPIGAIILNNNKIISRQKLY